MEQLATVSRGSPAKVSVPERLRVLVVFRSSLLAQGVAAVLRESPTLVTRTCDLDREVLLATLMTVRPQVVLVDIDDRGAMNGDLLQALLAANLQVKVLGLSTRHLGMFLLARLPQESPRVRDLEELIVALASGEDNVPALAGMGIKLERGGRT